jgi:hypothetical protein
MFTISLREIVNMTCLSEEYSAAAGGKILFTQPHGNEGLFSVLTSKTEKRPSCILLLPFSANIFRAILKITLYYYLCGALKPIYT